VIEFIERDASVAARRFAQRIVDRVELLQVNPLLGSVVQEDDTGTYRELLQGNYRIIYRASADAVYLVAIHHAARLLAVDELG
jgi:toxin ParE1/3/4